MTVYNGLCYIDDEPCDCGAMDVAGECPRDPYYHDDEDAIEAEYYANHFNRGPNDETNRF